MNDFKLVVESLKRDARFKLGLSTEQSNALAQQVQPMAEALSNLAQRVQAIRSDTRLSDQGKPAQTVAKLVKQAAEGYGENPSKAETIINALAVGWPWCPDLPEGTLAEVERTIGRQVSSEEQTQLEEAQAVQRLVDHATNEALRLARNQA